MKKPIATIILLIGLALNVFAQQEIPMFFDNELMLQTNVNSQRAYSPDGSKIATVFNDGKKIIVWDAATGRELTRIAGHGNNDISYFLFSPNGRQLATCAGSDSTVKIWDTISGALLRSINQTGVWAISYSPDGNRIAGSCYTSNEVSIKIWNTANGNEIRTLEHTTLIQSVEYSPDGRQILAASNNGIRIWDAGSGQTLRTISEGRFTNAVYSPNGRYITAYFAPLPRGNGLSAIRIYNAETGQETRSIPIQLSPYYLLYSPDGSQLLVNALDDDNKAIIKIFDPDTGRELRSFNNGDYAVAFNPDGRRILTASAAFQLRIEGTRYGASYATLLDAATGRVTGTIGYGPLNVGARAYADLQIARFLGDTAAVSRHEAVLQFITGRGNATRSEIETFYRNNIRAQIAEVVDEEFAGRTVPATILTKVKAEFKKVLGDFYATPTPATFEALLMEPIILEYRTQIIVGTGQAANFSALLGPNAQGVIEMTNAINVARRQLMDITGEDFNPVNTDEYRYFRNGEFNYGNTQYYFRNILNSLNINLDKMLETWERRGTQR